MKEKDFELNKKVNLSKAIYDKQLGHAYFRVYVALIKWDSWTVPLKHITYVEIGEALGFDRSTVAKAFKRLYELNYLICKTKSGKN